MKLEDEKNQAKDKNSIVEEDVPETEKDRVTFTEVCNFKIPENADVNVYESNRKIIIKYSWKYPKNLKKFKRLKGNKFKDLTENTTKEYPIRTFKSEKTLKENMRKLKQLINLHFGIRHNTHFITLTCKDDVQELEEIRNFWNRFIRKLKAKYPKYELCYIYKFERTEKGCWHIHFVIRDKFNRHIYMTNDDICKWWKKGFTYTQKVKNGYIKVGYDKEEYDEKAYNNPTEGVSTYMTKTTQLFDVPITAKVWGHSSNIQMPKPILIKNKDAENIIQEIGATLETEKTFDVNIRDYTINKHNQRIYNKNATAPKRAFTDFKESQLGATDADIAGADATAKKNKLERKDEK